MTLDLELLDQESAEEALRAVADEARRNDIDWALIGGLAMALYGSDRNTKDIEIIANKPLPFEGAGRLRQSGERYIIRTGRKGVAVDWIIRNDESRCFSMPRSMSQLRSAKFRFCRRNGW